MNQRTIAKALQVAAEQEALAKAAQAAGRRQAISDLNGKLTLASTGLSLLATGGTLAIGGWQARKAQQAMVAAMPQMTAAERMAAERDAAVQSVLTEKSATRAAKKAIKADRKSAEAKAAWDIIQVRLSRLEANTHEAMETSDKVTVLHQGAI